MRNAEVAGFPWKEETITDILLASTSPRLTARVFTKHEERRTGADWYWWWVHPSGETYGMLVQAKRLRISRVQKRWSFDFNYNSGSQRRALMETAKRLRVPPMYMLYLGTPDFRERVSCGAEHTSGRCLSCHAYTLAMYPALHATHIPVSDAGSTYGNSCPLEWLAEPFTTHGSWWAGMGLSPALEEFLRQLQSGGRAIARRLVTQLGRQARMGQFRQSGLQQVKDLQMMPPFNVLPDDRGHWQEPYFNHVLQGVREALPQSVMAAVETGEVESLDLPGDLAANVAGIVIAQVDERA